MKQAQDAIYIVTATPARGEELKQAIDLRGFDEILCVPYDGAGLLLRANPPALAIIDTEGQPEKTMALMNQLTQPVKSIVLSEQFDEEMFVTCHDRGARDFLVKPVPDAYLVSRVIRVLQECRLEQIVSQKDRILEELGVLSARSGVYTTSYFLKLLKKHAEEISPYAADPLSLLIVQLEGYQSTLPEDLQTALYHQVAQVIKECARGFDVVGEYFMDKFAVLLPQTGSRGGRALGKRLMERLDGFAFNTPHGQIHLRVRVGLADYTGCRHYEDLLNRALEDLRSSEPKAGTLPTA